MSKKILILGAGILQTPIIQTAKEMGYYVVVADANANAVGLKFADKTFILDITNFESMLSVALEEKIDGVLHPCSEVAIQVMGYLNDKLNLSGIGLNTAIRSSNKEFMRDTFKKKNAPSPKYFAVKNQEEAIGICNSLNFELIVKPSRNSGSRGITKLSKLKSKNEIILAFERALSNSHDEIVLIEEFIGGDEFSVEIVIFDKIVHIISITDKLTTGSPYFVEIGHSQPSLSKSEIQSLIRNTAILGCQALELNWCTAHVEIKVFNNKAYIIEIGPRLGGDFIASSLVKLSTGIDISAAAINLALGIKPNLNPLHENRGAAIRYFKPSPGILKYINYKKLLDNNLNIIEIEIYYKVGDIINELRSSIDRSGHVITAGKDAVDAISNAETALKMIEYKTEII